MKLSYSDNNLSFDILSAQDVNAEYDPKNTNGLIPFTLNAQGAYNPTIFDVLGNIGLLLMGRQLEPVAAPLFDSEEERDAALGVVVIPREIFMEHLNRLRDANDIDLRMAFDELSRYIGLTPDPG